MLGRGWWKREIQPFLSIIIIIAVMLGIFLMGMIFVLQYIEVWTETFLNNYMGG